MVALEANFEGIVNALVPLGALSPQSRAQLLNQSEVLHFKPGAFVFNEGDNDPYTFFLLEGQLELMSRGQTIQRLAGGRADAVYALAQLQPRKMSARAEDKVVVLRVERQLLEKLTAADVAEDPSTLQVLEIDSDETDDWMSRMLQSKLFENLPAANIHRIFSQLEPFDASAGEVIVSQGEPGDFYYVIVDGRAEITRAAGTGAPDYRLALIGPGDAFGEEALVGGGHRNASVKMLSDGALVRLGASDFADLIRKPLLSAVTLAEGRTIETARNAVWLDVRFPEQFELNALPRSVNHPLSTLRMHSGRLDPGSLYIVYCDDGSRSAVAAFLLAERGFNVHFLEGGLAAYSADGAEPEVHADLDLTLHDDESIDVATLPANAPVPSSHLSEVERPADPAVAANLEINKLRIAESGHLLGQSGANAGSDDKSESEHRRREEAVLAATEAARKAAQQDADQRLLAERQRADDELARARAKAEADAEERLEAERRKMEAAAKAAQLELAQARRLKQDLEKAKAAAEAQVEQERKQQVGRVEQLQVEMQRRLDEEERKLRERYAWQSEELERLQAQKGLAEERLKEEQQRVKEESAKARERLAQAREFEGRLEQVQRDSAAEAAQREEADLELKRRLRVELDQKVESERSKLEQELARNAGELERARSERDAAEAARAAATDEAEQIVADFKAAHARKRMQEEAEMRVERERLGTEAKRLRLAFELAQHERNAAVEHQRQIEVEIDELRDQQRAPAGQTDTNLETLQAEADVAAEQVARAEQARAQVQAAAVASEGDLAAHKVHEQQARAGLKQELDDWISDQAELENSDVQRQVLANQKVHMARIMQRADAARKAAKAHDQSLINDLADHLQNPDFD
jgi:CRP-like cAMP-binding protein